MVTLYAGISMINHHFANENFTLTNQQISI